MIELHNLYKFYKTDRHRKVILDNVSTQFEAGYSYGLLGVNGAGKSTTLRIIAGTELPNRGRVRRKVRVSWPLGFAGVFHPMMTGRENVAFVARAYGQDPRKIGRFVDDFAEIGDYMNAAVRTYSSGMMQRLAFGLSMAIEFDCYLIDEVTAVGDSRFQARCEEVFRRRRETTDLIVVSHSIGTVQTFCTRGAVLVDGRMIMFTNVEEAIEMYNRMNR